MKKFLWLFCKYCGVLGVILILFVVSALVYQANHKPVTLTSAPAATTVPVAPTLTVPTTTTAQSGSVASSPPEYMPQYCTATNVPYSTVTEDDPTTPVGQSRTVAGLDGKHYYCPQTSTSAGMDSTVAPINAIHYVGTKPVVAPVIPTPVTITEQQAEQNCAQYGDSSAYTQCLYAYGFTVQ